MTLNEIITSIYFDEWETFKRISKPEDIKRALISEGGCFVWKNVSELHPFPPPRPKRLRICNQSTEAIAAIIDCESGAISIAEEKKVDLWDEKIRVSCRPSSAPGEGSLRVTVWVKMEPIQDFKDWFQEKLAMVIHGLDALVARNSEADHIPARLAEISDVSFYGMLSDLFDGGKSFDQIAERRGVDSSLVAFIFVAVGNILKDEKATYSYRQEVAWVPFIELNHVSEHQFKIDIKEAGGSSGAVMTLSFKEEDSAKNQYKIPFASAKAASVLSNILQRLCSPEVSVKSPADLVANREDLAFLPINFYGTIKATCHSGDVPGPYLDRTGLDMWNDTVEFSILEAEEAQLAVEWLTADRTYHPQKHAMNLSRRTFELPKPTRAHVQGVILPNSRLAVTAASPVYGPA